MINKFTSKPQKIAIRKSRVYQVIVEDICTVLGFKEGSTEYKKFISLIRGQELIDKDVNEVEQKPAKKRIDEFIEK